MIGTGVQSHYQLFATCAVRPIARVLAWDPNEAGLMAFGWLITDLLDKGIGFWLEVLGGIALAVGAVLMQRERLVNGLTGVERAWLQRTWLRAHRRLIRAIRRVTSTGVAASAAFFSASASRAAGRSRQRVSHAFRFGIALKSISIARLMTAATLRSATVNSLPRK